MKICILGIDGAAPQVVFRDERLTNLRRLMDLGVYGLLESVVPPTTVPAWMSLAASQDPGSLGIYGLRHAEKELSSSTSILTLDRYLTEKGKKSVVPTLSREDEFDLEPKDQIKQEAFRRGEKQWRTIQDHFANQDWEFFQSLDTGLELVQRYFWSDFDPKHVLYKADNANEQVIADYYQWLDQRIGEILEFLDDQTIVAIVSAYGAQRIDGAIAINEWLIEQGLLVLREQPSTPTTFENLKVDWARTKAWSEGGECASIFFNLQGREPHGIVPQVEYQSLLEELTRRLSQMSGPQGQPSPSLILKPADTYKAVRGNAPDLLVEFGGLFYRSTETVGYGRVHLPVNEAGLPACNHSEYGMFILAAPNCPLSGEYEGARLLDIAPTLLDLAGYEIPTSMQGKSLVAGMEKKAAQGGQDEAEAQRLLQERLAGLGYI